MKNENSQVSANQATHPTTESKPAFNPINLLTEEQRKALGARFNKSWVTPRLSKVEVIQKEHGLDYFTACFTLAMLEDAAGLISSKKIAKVADTMYNLASELFGSPENQAAALQQIETAFDGLDVIVQPTAGKRFRTLVQKNFTSKMAVRVLEMVCEKLEVRESEWI